MDHEDLSNQLSGAIKGGEKYRTNKEVLDILYFVGNSGCEYSETPFYKFDSKCGKKGEIVSCEVDTVEATGDEKYLMNQIKSFFALGYFTNVNDVVLQPFRQSPKLLDERFRQNQKKIWEKYLKNNGFNDSHFLQELDVVLSPQQFEVIRDNPKMLLCPAESGSGKTQLLLAKALQSFMDQSVHSVYFCIPLPKAEDKWKRKNLVQIVEDFAKDKKALGSKFHIISDLDLSKLLRNKALRELKGMVLLIDEFHYDYAESFSITKEEFHALAMEIFPYLRNCWLANVTMHYLFEPNKELSSFFPPEFLCTKPLNVQFRSAKHIAEFCSNLVQVYHSGKFSSPRVCGTFLSKTQQQVQISEFTKSDVTETLINFSSSKCFSRSYEKSRWVVVLCSTDVREAWQNSIAEMLQEVSESKIVKLEDGIASCDFTGGEIQSLILIIDGPEDHLYKNDTALYNDLIVLASSRAQFELFIFVRNDLHFLITILKTCAKPVMAGNILKSGAPMPSLRQISKFCNSLIRSNTGNQFSDLPSQGCQLSKNQQILEVRNFKKNCGRFDRYKISSKSF